MDRTDEVVQIIKSKRTGVTVDEVVYALKDESVTDQEAIRALERDYWEAERYRQTREIPVGAAIEEQLADDRPTEREVLRRETINTLLRLINGLPRRQGQCIELYFFDHLTQQDISERLDIPQQNVAYHIAEALGKLRDTIATNCVKHPTNAIYSEGNYTLDLMRCTDSKYKPHRPLRFPFELWLKYCVGAGWSGNGVYAPRYENRLRDYLAACFDVPPVVGRFSHRRTQ